MKILVTRKLLDSDLQYIKSGLDKSIRGRYEIVLPDDYTEESLLKCCKDADIFLGPFVTRKLLENARNLKLIQVPWTGMDTFDFEAVKGFDIPVCNTHSNADAVAELGIALSLDLIKKVSYHDRKMREGNWNRDQVPLDLKSPMISQQTICILGCGNIGYRVAKLFKSFGSNIICVDNVRKSDEVITKVYCFEDIKGAIHNSDVVICCLPLTDETRGCLDANIFDSLERKPYIVNISRAAIFNEDDLYFALVNHRIAGFASDVWWNAPKRGESISYPSSKNGFWKLDNVLMSPHRAGFVDGCFPHLDGAIDNMIAFKRGEKLMNVVDISKGF